MSFLSGGMAVLFALPIAVVLYYLFRKKYTDTEVSSTLLWREQMNELEASFAMKQLQKNALLFLQLLTLVLFVLALMNPSKTTTTALGEQAIIIVDTSASMDAGADQSLFEQHKERLTSLLADWDGKPVTIVTTGLQPVVHVRSETDARKLSKAVEQLRLTYEQPFIERALQATQALMGEQATSVYIFTDELAREELPLQTKQVKWHVFGQQEKLVNVAITKFAATEQQGRVNVYVELHNDTEADVEAMLSLQSEERLLKKMNVTLAPGTTPFVIEQLAVVPTLEASIDVKDDYSLDNVAYTTILQEGVNVWLDGNTHSLVQKGLVSVTDRVSFFEQAVEPQGVIVTNDVKRLAKEMPVLLIGRNDKEAIAASGYVQQTKHALLSFSELKDVYVQAVYPPFPNFETIATVNDKPFLQVSPRGDVIVLADIAQTDWPLHPSFPLFLWSALQQFTTNGQALGTFTPLEQRSVALQEGDWAVYEGDTYVQSFVNGKQFTAPAFPGIYTLKGETEHVFAVSLAKEERQIAKGETYTLGQLTANDAKQTTTVTYLPYFAFVLFLLLIVEWEVQRRRGFSN